MQIQSDLEISREESFDGAEVRIYAPMLAWWRKTSAQLGRLPTRKDLLPEDLPPQSLPHIVITEFESNPARIRFRLFGGAHVTFNQRDFTGLYLDELIPNRTSIDYVTGLYREMQRIQRPLWSVNQVRHPRTGQQLIVQRLMLPLASNGVNVDLCLALQTYQSQTSTAPGSDNAWHMSPEAGEKVRRFL